MKRIGAFVRRWWWALALLFVGILALFFASSRGRRELLAPMLKLQHEADMDAKMAKWKLDEQRETEIRQIREEKRRQLRAVDVAEHRKREQLAQSPDALMDYYRGLR